MNQGEKERAMKRRLVSAVVAAAAVGGLTLGTACTSEEEKPTPAPTEEKTTPTKPKETEQQKPKPKPKSERADLLSFRLDDRSQAGITDVWVVWTIKNSSSEKSDYSWDWEAVDSSGTRVANSSELVTDVQPGQVSKGEDITTLKTANGIKLNITEFNRTASY